MTNAEARFNKSHIRKVYACLAVTCHLHFWQNDRDFLRATVVTRGWNGYRNKSQHRKSTLDVILHESTALYSAFLNIGYEVVYLHRCHG